MKDYGKLYFRIFVFIFNFGDYIGNLDILEKDMLVIYVMYLFILCFVLF